MKFQILTRVAGMYTGLSAVNGQAAVARDRSSRCVVTYQQQHRQQYSSNHHFTSMCASARTFETLNCRLFTIIMT